MIGWSRRSENTMNLTIKYPRFNKKIKKSQVVTWSNSSPVIGSNHLVMRNIECRKFSIPKFQYYWIPKKFQYRSSIYCTKNFSIIPDVPKISKWTTFSAKESTKVCLFVCFHKNKKFQYFRYSSVFLALIPKIAKSGIEIKYKKKMFLEFVIQKM